MLFFQVLTVTFGFVYLLTYFDILDYVPFLNYDYKLKM